MNDETAERIGFAIYRRFIRFGVGSCQERTVNGERVPETPDEACVRRWRRLPEKVRSDFIAEGQEAIRAFEDGI